ncbi:MAG: ATP:cob(I)alamin adenosyltransferase [Acidimicrobiia bacterium]
MRSKKKWPFKPYTRTGDSGETGLLFGGKVKKYDPGPEAYGACDEACSALGLARAANTDPGLEIVLKKLQRELFVVGAELATAPENREKLRPGETKVSAEMVQSLERLIDALLEFCDPPRAFVLPGQNLLAAYLDYARTVIRRAERAVVAAQAAGWVSNEYLLAYMNRLGDLVYTLARWQEGSKYEKL